MNSPSLSWDFAEKLRNLTKMKLMIKGIETHEDASLCLRTRRRRNRGFESRRPGNGHMRPRDD